MFAWAEGVYRQRVGGEEESSKEKDLDFVASMLEGKLKEKEMEVVSMLNDLKEKNPGPSVINIDNNFDTAMEEMAEIIEVCFCSTSDSSKVTNP